FRILTCSVWPRVMELRLRMILIFDLVRNSLISQYFAINCTPTGHIPSGPRCQRRRPKSFSDPQGCLIFPVFQLEWLQGSSTGESRILLVRDMRALMPNIHGSS